MGGVYNCLNQRRGIVNEEEQVQGTPLAIVRAYLPVAECNKKFFLYYILFTIILTFF
jgi:translation elongation factor EF-G